jgi:hypothetical protein
MAAANFSDDKALDACAYLSANGPESDTLLLNVEQLMTAEA